MMKKYGTIVISRIIALRRRGFSIPEISRELKVSKSTALRHSRNVTILGKYRQRWLDRRNASKIMSDRKWRLAFEKAEKLITDLTPKELVLVGACLYWAEGTKKDFSLSNTDPAMIKVFLQVLRKQFNVVDGDIKVSLRVYDDLDVKKCIRYWSDITKLNLKKNVSINVLKGFKKGKLQYGMCRIRVRKSGLLLKEMHSIINRISAVIPS